MTYYHGTRAKLTIRALIAPAVTSTVGDHVAAASLALACPALAAADRRSSAMKIYPATREQLLGHAGVASAFARPEDAERAVNVVLEALRERLGDNEAAAIARDLPPAFARALRSGSYLADFEPDDLYARVGDRASVPRAIGVEQTQIVLHAIGDAVSDDTRALLERELPRAWSDLLFGEREIGEPPPHGQPREGPKVRRTLSTGHPGYVNPIADSPPPAGHTHSVAQSDTPHSDTKLSTGHPHTRRGEH